MATAEQDAATRQVSRTSNSSVDHNIVLVSQRQGGHALASGYDRLQEYLDCCLIRPPARWNLAQRTSARVLRPVMGRSGSRWYHRSSLIGEISAAREWLRGRGRVFHFLYGENSYRYLGLMKALAAGNRIVCTYHTPPEKFRQVVTDLRHIERLDAAIVVSTIQMEFFCGILGHERVFFIPHGIDVEYFRPAALAADAPHPFTCLFVGSHLRDIATLAQTARLLAAEPDVRLIAVTRPTNRATLAALDNVVVRSGLDDAQLLRAYQDADLLVLPLLDATANNTLLEAMACGLPIVSTDLPGVRDYVNADCAVLTPIADAPALADAIAALKRDGAKRARMARACRERAQDLSWENVARQTLDVYRAAGLRAESGQGTN